DDTTHIETWEAVRSIAGKSDFLYVADSKLCTSENMNHINGNKDRFLLLCHRLGVRMDGSGNT
ncbi:hypothetical protein B1A_12999, partial [mine drainage metagenome]